MFCIFCSDSSLWDETGTSRQKDLKMCGHSKLPCTKSVYRGSTSVSIDDDNADWQQLSGASKSQVLAHHLPSEGLLVVDAGDDTWVLLQVKHMHSH